MPRPASRPTPPAPAPRWTKPTASLAAGLILAAASGCSPVGVAVGAGATAATAAQQEKGFKQAVTTWIRDRGQRALPGGSRAVRPGQSVRRGAGVPHGAGADPEDRVEATRLTWQVQGVQEVINELQVDDSSSIVDAADQLTGALRQPVFDSAVRSINYSIATVQGRIYLFGIARSVEELDRVVNHGRNVRYARDVTSYVRVAEPKT